MAGFATAFASAAPYIQAGSTILSMVGQQQQTRAAVSASGNAAVAATRSAEVDRRSAELELQSAEFDAVQYEYLAGQAMAVSQREAEAYQKDAALLASKALANAAGSGAGASDPTVVKIISSINAEGAYRAAVALYSGNEKAKATLQAATARRMGGMSAAAARYASGIEKDASAQSRLAEGKAIQQAGDTAMLSTLLQGGTSWAEKYGGTFFNGASGAGA